MVVGTQGLLRAQMEYITCLVLDVEPLLCGLFMDVISVVALQVRVHYGNHASTVLGKAILRTQETSDRLDILWADGTIGRSRREPKEAAVSLHD